MVEERERERGGGGKKKGGRRGGNRSNSIDRVWWLKNVVQMKRQWRVNKGRLLVSKAAHMLGTPPSLSLLAPPLAPPSPALLPTAVHLHSCNINRGNSFYNQSLLLNIYYYYYYLFCSRVHYNEQQQSPPPTHPPSKHQHHSFYHHSFIHFYLFQTYQ